MFLQMRARAGAQRRPLAAHLLRFLALAACVCAFDVRADYTELHAFAGSDGKLAVSPVVEGADGNFYGATASGGTHNAGTIYRISDDGTLTSLYNFTGGSDGNGPNAALVQGPDGNFYGSTAYGNGTIFRITPSGELTTLYRVTQPEYRGLYHAMIVAADGNLYGTSEGYYTASGEPCGMAFRMTTTGQFTLLHEFTGPDGCSPQGLMQANDGNFYGVTSTADASNGTIFRMTPSGSVTTLHAFESDALYPSELMQAQDGYLYGTTYGQPYVYVQGTVFRIGLDGAAYNVVHRLNHGDAAGPKGGLVQRHDGAFFGMSETAVYALAPAGNVVQIYAFDGGAEVSPGIVLARDGKLYGTTVSGGASSNGAVFKVSVPEPLPPPPPPPPPPSAVPSWSDPTPANGSNFSVSLGIPFAISLRATDTPAAVTVQIRMSGTQPGMTLTSTDGNPADATLRWTPTSSQVGRYTVTFTAEATPAAPQVATRTFDLFTSKRSTTLTAVAPIQTLGLTQLNQQLSAKLLAYEPFAPAAGKKISFYQGKEGAGGKAICSSITDANGLATCAGLPVVLQAALGYWAEFAGDDLLYRSSGQSSVIAVGPTQSY